MKAYKTYLNPDTKYFRRTNRSSTYFYIVKCHDEAEKYIKVGTTERTIAARFSNYEYDIDEILFVAEVPNCYEWEYNVKMHLKSLNGLYFLSRDRFTYSRIPKKLIEYIESLDFCA